MNLKQQMKWRLNDLLALDGSEAGRKAFFSEFTQPCAHDIMTAPAGSPLTGLRRQRRLWATLGYVFIVLFLATAAALVVGYWLVSDHRVAWLGKGALIALVVAGIAEVGLMLLCANRVTALQNRHAERCAKAILKEYQALPQGDADAFPRLLSQAIDPDDPGQPVGCCACGALFERGEIDPAAFDHACPRCGEKYQLVFGGADAALDEASLRRLQSFLNR